MTLNLGARLGPYEILSALGAGGMGEVYRARDTKLGRDVALKVLPEAFTHDAERVARFQREAHTLAALNHQNIAAIYGLEEANGVTALIMELVDGEDLSQRISRGAIPLDEALPIAKQIAEALEAAHEQGIIHRDLKPANVKVRSDGMVKVLDFGLAKALDRASESGGAGRPGGPAGFGRPDFPDRPDLSASPTITSPAMLTGAGMILGTAAYMSPEQAKGRPVDRRADIWAFACVLFEMLTGTRAFEGEGVSETLARVIEREPSWDRLPAKVPPSLRTYLERSLRKDPRQRVRDIGDVRLALEGAFDTTTPQSATSSARRERLAWGAATVGAALLAAATMVVVRGPTPEAPLTRLDVVTPPTTDPFSFALSSDGRQLVFVATGDTGSQLWLRPLDQPNAKPLAGTEGASYPFWAPDGRAVGFFAGGSLKRLDLTGGTPQVLAVAPSARGGTWSRDGVIVFPSTIGSGLMRVAADGGVTTVLTQLAEGQAGHIWPQFLPDGRRFLFFVGGGAATQGEYIGSLDGGVPTRVLAAESPNAYAPPGYLLQVSQGVLVARRFDSARGGVSGDPFPVASGVGSQNERGAFAVSAAGLLAHRGGEASRRQLVWVDRSGRVLGSVGPPVDKGMANVELAPDGAHVAVGFVWQGSVDVWVIEVARGLESRFTSNPAIDASPLWSPDSSRLVFRSNRQGKMDLYEKPANGATDERPLLETPQDKGPQSWSPDGRYLLYGVQDPKTASDLWALPLTGEPKPFPVVQTEFDETQGQFSPNSQWVAYASNETGRYEVYVRPFPSGGRSQVSIGGGIAPRWRPDGKELFYVAPDNRMMAAQVEATGDGRTLSARAPVALFATRLVTGNTGVGGYTSRAQYAVAGDGRFLLNVSTDDAAPPITVVQNWTLALKK